MKPLLEIINTDNEPNTIEHIMDNTKITSELVKELYRKYKNQQFFISCFGTKRFHLVSQEQLNKMYNFLIKKVK